MFQKELCQADDLPALPGQEGAGGAGVVGGSATGISSLAQQGLITAWSSTDFDDKMLEIINKLFGE